MNNNITQILCKKNFRTNFSNGAGFIKNEFYKQFSIETEDLSNYIIPYVYKYIYVYTNNQTGGHRFHLDKNDHTHYIPNFYDYFYDDIEIRKIKLKKLSNI